MISARIRFSAMLLGTLAALAALLVCVVRGAWLDALAFLILANTGVVCCGLIRRTVIRLQQEQAHQLAHLPAPAAGWGLPRGGWCCETGWLTHGADHQPARCTRAQQR